MTEKSKCRKIAIIGAGIFGLHIGYKLSLRSESVEVHIFEQNKLPMTNASSNNQHRMHLGFHYPRSKKTVGQILEANKKFVEEFSDCLYDIPTNLYAIENQSNINFQEFVDTYEKKMYTNVVMEDYSDILKTEMLQGIINTQEKGIDTKKIKEKILSNIRSRKNISIFFGTKWQKNLYHNYDYVINCSYYNPQLTTSKIHVKYELCSIPLLENPIPRQAAITIMDGPFSSLYPTQDKNIYTLSNVKETPFFITNDKEEIAYAYSNIKDFDLTLSRDRILEAASQHIRFSSIKIVDNYVAIKCKPRYDIGDVRTSEIVVEDKNITILQGKISTVSTVSDLVGEYIK